MRTRNVVWVGVVLSVASTALAGAPDGKGKVEAVTLYRGQALVTRSVPVDAPAGQVELVVGALPAEVVPDSLFAEGAEGLEVRAVRFRTRAVGEEPREDIRKLDEQIELLGEKAARNKKMAELVVQRLAFLDKLEGFTAPTAKMELSKGVLNVDSLKQIALFSFEERQKAADESLKLAIEAKTLEKELQLLQRERGKLAGGSTRTEREAVVFLEKREAGPAAIKLSYLVSSAGWLPAYNFRSSKDNKSIRVEYNAIVQQTSGESWDAVALTLSTASPVLSAQGPGLAPFRVVLASVKPQGQAKGGKGVAARVQFAQQRLQEFAGRQQAAASLRKNRDANWEMNVAANDFQGVELTVGHEVLEMLRAEPAARTEGPSVSYALTGTVSLASRSDQQMLRISSVELETRFYHVATPILTTHVYREAELTNTSADVLLAGPVSVYLDGRFVGRAELPTVAKGETFVMGFGADPQLRARRELADKSEAVQGGNREMTLKYRLVLENYNDAAVAVRIFDRLPYADRKADIRITLDEMKEKLSEDKLYARLERPKGILRWDVQVPAAAAAENAYMLEYGYKLEFDRNVVLATPTEGKLKEQQREFEELQDRRFRR